MLTILLVEVELTHLCPPLRSTFAVRETQSLRQQMLSATVGINELIRRYPEPVPHFWDMCEAQTVSIAYTQS